MTAAQGYFVIEKSIGLGQLFLVGELFLKKLYSDKRVAKDFKTMNRRPSLEPFKLGEGGQP